MSPNEATNHAPGSPREGEVIAGKYRVERLLGSGGMGMVVAAHHLVLDERVALKFLLPGATSNAELVGRFIREARAAAKIKSEHVARVTDVGQLDDGSPYMVMEYLEGSDLATYLTREGPLPLATTVDFVLQACEALAEAHGLGIIHRDLKPANLFCVERGDDHRVIKVLDFGISKLTAVDPVSHSLTHTNALMGSPIYMSPEQMQSAKTVDARSDIWSLGVILFELLTGNPPFDAPLVTELVFKIATETAPPLRSLRPDAPEGMERVIARCLLRDRAARYPTVAALAVALREFGSPSAATSVEAILRTMRRAGVAEADFDAEAPTDLAIRLPKPPGSQPALLGVGRDGGPTPGASSSDAGVVGPSTLYGQQTSARREAKRGVPRGAAALVGLVTLVVGGIAVRTLLTTHQASATLTPDVLPSASVTVMPAVDVDASASRPAPPIPSSLAGATAPPTSSALPARVPTPPRPRPPSATAAPAVNCDPPTWQDQAGHVHIKKGCR